MVGKCKFNPSGIISDFFCFSEEIQDLRKELNHFVAITANPRSKNYVTIEKEKVLINENQNQREVSINEYIVYDKENETYKNHDRVGFESAFTIMQNASIIDFVVNKKDKNLPEISLKIQNNKICIDINDIPYCDVKYDDYKGFQGWIEDVTCNKYHLEIYLTTRDIKFEFDRIEKWIKVLQLLRTIKLKDY